MTKKKIIALLISLPLVMGLTGCSGGVNGEGTKDYSIGTPIVRGNAFNDLGWEYIGKGQYDSAIAQFNKVIADNPTPDELTEADNGLGWARSFRGQLKDGMPWFEKAAPGSNDAKVGLAAAYLQKASRDDLEKVIDLLHKQLGKENPHFTYTARRNTGVSNAEVHAMLAYAFAATGADDEGREQLEYAKELNEKEPSATFAQLSSVVDFLLR